MSPRVLFCSPDVSVVDRQVQAAVFEVSVKPEVVVCRPEVVFRDRQWLSPARYSDCDHAECEGILCFDSVSITFVHIAGARAYGDQAFELFVCPVCLSVTLVYCGQTVGWIKM